MTFELVTSYSKCNKDMARPAQILFLFLFSLKLKGPVRKITIFHTIFQQKSIFMNVQNHGGKAKIHPKS